MAKKILIVDDDKDILKIIKARLESNGYDVVTAIDGEQAVEIIKLEKPDLIIADLMMPNLNGWGLTQKLKNDPEYKKTPILLLSGLLEKDSLPENQELGDYYMAKPFELGKLLTKIDELLALRS